MKLYQIMKIKSNPYFYFIVCFFIVFKISMYGSSTNKLCLDLLEYSISLHVPKGGYLQKIAYEEGVVYSITYKDSSVIIITEGAMALFPPDYFHPEKTLRMKDKTILEGREKKLYWKKIQIDEMRIYYYNCKRKQKRIFDRSLNKMKYNGPKSNNEREHDKN